MEVKNISILCNVSSSTASHANNLFFYVEEGNPENPVVASTHLYFWLARHRGSYIVCSM